MTETIKQLIFWGSVGALPISLILFVYGGITKNRKATLFCFFISPVLIAHSLWYFQTLGIMLADKTGDGEYPIWLYYVLIGVIFGVVLVTGFLIRPKNKNLDSLKY